MSNQSNIIGRAYEYICMTKLNEEINKVRYSEIEKNSSYYIAKECWDCINLEMQESFKKSAITAVLAIFDLEPMILEDGKDKLVLKLQKDSEGEIGDVRDIIIVRRDVKWEIGLSIKHNHFAVKHSRLGKTLDFGEKWFGVKCSEQYWKDIEPIFSYLNAEKTLKTKWSDLPDKENDVYVPLLKAFIDEINRNYKNHSELPKKLVEYLLGEYDFYKIISIDDFKPQSSNTVELYLDGGWQFSFRIHNASTIVETSLKFDIQIIGMPTTIISIECLWNN